MENVGHKKQVCIHILKRSGQQRKWPCHGISEMGSEVVSVGGDAHAWPVHGGGIIWFWKRQKRKLLFFKKYNENIINDKKNFVTPLDTCKNTVRRLCLLAMSVSCWVFVPARLLKNPKPKNPRKLSWNSPCLSVSSMYSNNYITTYLTFPSNMRE